MTWIIILFATLLISAGITAFMIPQIILISHKKKLYDPVNNRKIHHDNIPRLGGVAFFPSILISLSLMIILCSLLPNTSISTLLAPEHSFLISGILLTYSAGITDDIINLDYKTKFCFQLISATLVVMSGIHLDNLCGLLGVHEISAWAGVPLSIFLIAGCINAINLIDGIDGLASGLSIIALIFLSSLFSSGSPSFYPLLAFATMGTLFPFFFHNVFGKPESGSKIFMGDCGSQTMGLILGVLIIRFSKEDYNAQHMARSLVTTLSLLIVPLFDLARVMLHRLRNRKNPFLPDQNHIHHKFMKLGLSQRTALVVILSLGTFFTLFNFSLQEKTDINLLLFLDVLIWTVFHIILSLLIKRKEKKTA